MNKSSNISVIIPAYNAEAYLAETLRSVFAQSLPPYEVIVINDGSKDKTSEVAKQFPVILIDQINQGPAMARNAGVFASKTPWVAFLDADDTWDTKKLETAEAEITKYPDADVIATNMMTGNPENGWKPIELSDRYDKKKSFFLQLYRKSFLATSTLVVRKELIINEGGFDPSYFGPEDFDLWLKIALHGGHLYFINSYLTNYRIHNDSITSDPSRTYKDTLLILQKYKKNVSLALYTLRILILHVVIAQIFFNQKKFKKAFFALGNACLDILFRPIDYFI